MMEGSDSFQSKARRRKSLAHAMKLVDSAIANLEVASVAPSVDVQKTNGNASPAVTYRRRRSTISSGARRPSNDGSCNPLLQGGRQRAVSVKEKSVTAVLSELADRCAASPDLNGQITSEEVEHLRESINESSSDIQGLRDSGRPPLTDIPSWDHRLSQETPTVKNLRTWNFDVFETARVHPEETMVVVGYAMFQDSGLFDNFNIDTSHLVAFLAAVERGYLDNPYHNHLHGLDVGQSVHYFLHYAGLGVSCTPLERFAMITAALVHDMGHWGLNNNWLSATDDSLALTYNYISPLENLHASKAMKLLAKAESNIVVHLSPADKKSFKAMLVKFVLATDMANHGTDLAQLKTLNLKNQDNASDWVTNNDNDRHLVLKVALHAADVSNPAKPWNYYNQWTDRVLQEFFKQGDMERASGLPIGMGFDRHKCESQVDKANGQLGFINFVVKPLYDAFSQVPCVHLEDSALKHLNENITSWKDITTGAVNTI